MTIEEEHKLIKKAQEDVTSFEAVYDIYYLPIYYYVVKRTDNRDIAGEVTSIVFLKAIENIKKYKFQGLPFSAWLYRIAHNTLMDMFRGNKTQQIIDASSKQLETIAIEVESEEDEYRLKAILEMIPQLAEEEIALLELRYFEDRRFKEISEILNITEQGARVKVHRLIHKIKTMLKVKI